MIDRPTRREFSALALAMLAAGRGSAFGQDEPAKANPAPAAGALPGPDAIPGDNRGLPALPTVPVRRDAPSYNFEMIDTSLLPRDKQGIWVLDFGFKTLRIYSLEVDGKRRVIHYLYYRVVNRTGKAREFVPQFTLVTDTNKRYEESVLPRAVKLIQAREDPSIRLLGPVDVIGMIPPSTKPTVDDAVFGVAMWEGIDPHADKMSIYIRGLSDGYQEVTPPDSKPVVRYKTLKIDLIRRGDARNLSEKEISRAEPPYEWIYW